MEVIELTFNRIIKRLGSDRRLEEAARRIAEASGSGVITLTYGNNGQLIRVACQTEIKADQPT